MNLQLCITNDDHKMYGSWDIEHDRKKNFFFWSHFLPFYPTNNSKNPNFEKMIKKPEILSFYTCVPQMTIVWCVAPEILDTTVILVYFLHFYPHNNSKNQNFEKMKKPQEIS